MNDLQNKFQLSHLILKFKNNFIFLTLLIIQNLTIFWRHYFFDAGFPWDFIHSLYGIPAFLTTAWSLGIFPQWMPFQSMGYPIAMLPLDHHYPIFWIYSLLGIQYTMNIAVFTQTLHVLFGAFGMYLLLSTLFKSPKYAFIGALAFQFFGGFYSNAEHVSYIRAFALTPWLFYVFYFGFKENKISKRILFIPIVVFALLTAAIANIMSSIFMMATFVSAQLIRCYFNGFGRKNLVFISLFLLVLTSVGIAMSAGHLGPPFQERDYLYRLESFKDQNRVALSSEALPALFLSSKLVTDPPYPSMKSVFVTLPIVILASFLPISELKKYLIFLVPLIIGILMALGENTPFYSFIISIIPALGIMRFPSAEYRIFIALPIIIFGILSLKIIVENRPSWKFILIRSLFVGLWFVTGILMLYYGIVDVQVIIAIFIMFLTILTIIYLSKIIQYSRNISTLLLKKKTLLPFVIIALLITVDGFVVISDIPTWTLPSINQVYNNRYVNLVEDGKLITFKIFENLPSERPEREMTPTLYAFSWKGYLTGKYMMQDDIAGASLVPKKIVESNDIYTQYMLMKWTPILLDPNSVQIDDNRISLPEETFTNLKPTDENPIKQIHYGIDDITYEVSLSKPMLLVENEIYFPGWKASLIYPDKEVKIDALVTNEVFRSWNLPEGDYQMRANFQFPNFILYQIISVTAFVIWIPIVIIYWRKKWLRIPNKFN